MADQRAENFPVSGLCFRAHEINHMLCKVGVEFGVVVFGSCPAFCAVGGVIGTVGSHDEVVLSLVLEGSWVLYRGVWCCNSTMRGLC